MLLTRQLLEAYLKIHPELSPHVRQLRLSMKPHALKRQLPEAYLPAGLKMQQAGTPDALKRQLPGTPHALKRQLPEAYLPAGLKMQPELIYECLFRCL
jgi:hypothetical protein